jgi:hypothetical protein
MVLLISAELRATCWLLVVKSLQTPDLALQTYFDFGYLSVSLLAFLLSLAKVPSLANDY